MPKDNEALKAAMEWAEDYRSPNPRRRSIAMGECTGTLWNHLEALADEVDRLSGIVERAKEKLESKVFGNRRPLVGEAYKILGEK